LLYRHHKQSVSQFNPAANTQNKTKAVCSPEHLTGNRKVQNITFKAHLLSKQLRLLQLPSTILCLVLWSYSGQDKSPNLDLCSGFFNNLMLPKILTVPPRVSAGASTLSGLGNGSLKVDYADKCYTGGPKEREWLC